MDNEKKKGFLIRLRSSVIVTVLAGGALFCGGLVLFLAVAAVSMIGLFELFRALGLRKTALEAAGFMGAALFLEAVWLGWDKGLMLALFLSLMLILGTYVFTWPKYTA
ncbi:MAG: phosphatidate cytidylyltransferase, partial [Lachnospiraceae bacterium]|nr:phosphatidate cytidylyltransferase [Lachnospiraceae bacterium]